MLAGISTACFYPMETEKALELLAEKGVCAAEVFLNSYSELRPEYLRELRRIADRTGLRILSVHPFTSGMEPMLFFSGYSRRFEDGMECYRAYYDAANILGAEIVVFHGSLAQFPVGMDEYCERFGRLMGDASARGVTLCHENVSRCSGRTPSFFRELSARLPKARYVLDVKQAVRAGQDVFDFAQAMGTALAHVHISDHTLHQDCLSLGKGIFNIANFLSYLNARQYRGGVIVELYRENFGEIVELLEGYQLLCREISTIT